MIDLKKSLRKKQRDLRHQFSFESCSLHANSAATIFAYSEVFKKSQHIACYLATAGEFDTTPLINAIWSAGKKCYLPIISNDAHPLLSFGLYQKGDVLQPNRYHILEPTTLVTDRFSPLELDMVLLPLLAFDSRGFRLGSGGGYYDRTFAFLRNAIAIKPLLIGLGYAEQEVPLLPFERWDVPLHGVLTQKELRFFGCC